MRYLPYYRVSTQRQGRSGLGLEAQKVSVAEYVRRDSEAVLLDGITEIESGRRSDRPELARAVAIARASRATLVVAKLDRLARDAKFLLTLVDSGVPVAFGDLPNVATGDPITGRLILTVLAAIAEFEARRIAQRIKEAAAIRRARGDKMGSRDPRCQHMTNAHRLAGSAAAHTANRRLAAEYRSSMRTIMRSLGKLPACKIAEELNAKGYTTRRGKPWSKGTVSLVLRLLPWEKNRER